LPVFERDDLVRLGSDYGGWWVPEQAISTGGCAYCAGVGIDVTFDVALIDRYDCEVWAFDPTPSVIDAVVGWDTPDRWHFEPVGLWDRESTIRFYAPARLNHGSLSATNAQRTEDFIEARVEALPAIMRRLGHDRLDILKMDIEGAEGRVLESMLSSGIRPTVLCVEFDQPEVPWRTRRRVRALLAGGYVLVRVEYWNYTFLLADAHPSKA
jgi:FkbM family methyltransferase